MLELTVSTAGEYLSSRGWKVLRVEELGGGVSNTVLLVETSTGRFVVKQALGRLRVAEEWLCDRERVFRECLALRELAPCLPAGHVPAVLFEDRENYLFAMEAAPAGACSWKSLLLGGVIDGQVAARVGRMLSELIRAGLERPSWALEFGGQAVFDQLRLDPYYRFTATRHPGLAQRFERLIADTRSRAVSLVHGDWSPKNFLIDGDRVMAIDFEVLHFGDPSFDVAFLLNHLLLKSFHNPQWRLQYREAGARFWRPIEELVRGLPWLPTATLQHLGCLLLARVDGKSPAEYIRTEEEREPVRRYARRLILDPPGTIDELLTRWP